MARILARKWIQEPEIGNGKLWSWVDWKSNIPLFCSWMLYLLGIDSFTLNAADRWSSQELPRKDDPPTRSRPDIRWEVGVGTTCVGRGRSLVILGFILRDDTSQG